MRKKKNIAKKEKQIAKSAREAFRFQVNWEAKKLFPNGMNSLADRIEAECLIIEEARLRRSIRQLKLFVDAYRMQFDPSATFKASSFLKESIVLHCLGIHLMPFDENQSMQPEFSHAILEESQWIEISVDLSSVETVLTWMKDEFGLNAVSYADGFEVEIDAFTFRISVAKQLQDLILRQAEVMHIGVSEELEERVRREVRYYLSKTNTEKLLFLDEFYAFGHFMVELRSTFGKSVVEKYTDSLRTCAIAYCFGITTELVMEKTVSFGNMELELTANSIDYNRFVGLLKEKFDGFEMLFSNSIVLEFGLLRLRYSLNKVLCSIVKKEAKKLYKTKYEEIEQRMNAELDWYAHWKAMSGLLLLRSFINDAKQEFNASIGSNATFLGHSLVAFCLGITKDFPELDNEKANRFFQQKKYTAPAHIHFDSGNFEDIAKLGREYFRNTQWKDDSFSFGIGRLHLTVYKNEPEPPGGLRWYELLRVQNMLDYYSRISYS